MNMHPLCPACGGELIEKLGGQVCSACRRFFARGKS